MGRKMSRVTRISPSVEQVDGSSVRRVVSKFKPSVVQVGTCKRESAAIPYNCIPLRQLTTTCKWWSVPIGTALDLANPKSRFGCGDRAGR